jgi:Tfp pilus assembly protein PilW
MLFFSVKNNKHGFTLVEMVLYLAIFTGILLTASSIFNTAMQSRVKSQTIAEVEQQGAQVVQLMTQTIRNATAINSPSTGASASSLSINVVTGANSPSIFDLSAGQLRIKEGVATAVPLTNSRIVISSLIFYNLTRASTKGIISFQFTLSHVNPSNLQEYGYSKTFYGSASLR